MLFVLEPSEDNLAVAFLKAGAAFGGEGVGAAGAADARFVIWRLYFPLLKWPTAAEADLAFARFQAVGNRDTVVEHKTFPLP